MWRVNRRYKSAKKIHMIVDNLNTHASWLNPAEIEASRVSRECLGRRRIGHFHTLKFEVAAWRERADREARPIRWAFTVKDARRVFRYDGIVTRRSEH